VILAGAIVGAAIGSHAAQYAKNRRAKKSVAGKRADQLLLSTVGWHSAATLDPSNYGRPSELSIRGSFHVGVPNEIGSIEAVQADISLTVADAYGNKFVDMEKIGTVVDVPGKGYWSQDFSWTESMMPGRYKVGIAVHDPRFTRGDGDGGRTPYYLAMVEQYIQVN
jgi:hypothetical protein